MEAGHPQPLSVTQRCCPSFTERVPPHPLSPHTAPLQTVLDALRARKERFMFEEVEISLKPRWMPCHRGAGAGVE